jgi:peptide/nickel transport system permease protein
MAKLIVHRVLYGVFTLWAIATILFFMLQLSGDPAVLYVSPRATPAAIDTFREVHGFNDPVLVQYARFLREAATGSFGESLTFGRPALGVVWEFLPASLVLAATAIAMAVLIGAPVGIIAALRKGKALDMTLMTASLAGLSIPAFWLGLILILLFAVDLQWFPVGGKGGIEHLVLPGFTIALAMAGSLARLLRSNLVEVLDQDYIRTARAMGVPRRSLIGRHALKNAALPVLTSFSLEAALVLTGVFVVEVVYAYPGMGRITIDAINQQDFAVVQASIFVGSLAYILMNLVVDIAYTFLDPRIRYGARGA